MTADDRVATSAPPPASAPLPASAPPPASADVRFEAETVSLLAERGRAAFALIVVAVLAFAVADVAANRDVLAPLLGIAGLQIASALAGMAALGGAPSRARAVTVPVLVLGFVFVSGTVSDVVSHNLYATSTMS